MGRYSDINRGPELAAAYLKRQTWLGLDKAAKKAAYDSNSYKDKPIITSAQGFIAPFGAKPGIYLTIEYPKTATGDTLATNPLAGVTTFLAPAATASRVLTEQPTGAADQVITVPKFKAAKIYYTEKDPIARDQISRITGNPYKQYKSTTISGRFGRKTDTEQLNEAIAAARTAAQTWTNTAPAVRSARVVTQISYLK